MTEKAGEYQALRRTLDGIMGGSTPAMKSDKAARMPVITVNGGTVIIGGGNHIHPPARMVLITEAQSRCLKDLVAKIGRLERAKNPHYSNTSTWTRLNALFAVEWHSDIPSNGFDRAKAYLEGWLRNLNPP